MHLGGGALARLSSATKPAFLRVHHASQDKDASLPILTGPPHHAPFITFESRLCTTGVIRTNFISAGTQPCYFRSPLCSCILFLFPFRARAITLTPLWGCRDSENVMCSITRYVLPFEYCIQASYGEGKFRNPSNGPQVDLALNSTYTCFVF